MSETRLAMASEWMTNGNVNEFVKAHVDADRLGLVSTLAKPAIVTLGNYSTLTTVAERRC